MYSLYNTTAFALASKDFANSMGVGYFYHSVMLLSYSEKTETESQKCRVQGLDVVPVLLSQITEAKNSLLLYSTFQYITVC